VSIIIKHYQQIHNGRPTAGYINIVSLNARVGPIEAFLRRAGDVCYVREMTLASRSGKSVHIRGYKLPLNVQNFMQKDSAQAKISSKVVGGGLLFLTHPVYLSKQQSTQTGYYTIAACFPFEPLEKCMTLNDLFQDFPGGVGTLLLSFRAASV